jgi:RNA polymerase sigma-70 factor (ECF subfamily)
MSINEEQAVAALRRRDTAALEWVMDAYAAYVSTIVTNIIGSCMTTQDVEETASDVFLALWHNADKLKPGKLKAYLASIARSRAKNKLRERGKEVPLDDDIIITGGDTPQTILEEREEKLLVRRAIENMPPPDREIFLRHYYYCQSVATIAEEMAMNASTVKTHLARGREKLRDTLNKGGDFDGKANFGAVGLHRG